MLKGHPRPCHEAGSQLAMTVSVFNANGIEEMVDEPMFGLSEL
jgi:hypothetical protein